MAIQILGGMAKGHPLLFLDSTHLRPTNVMLKRRVFDSFQDFDGYLFIDLFAGVGSVGLEALSRNAAKCVLIEKEKKHFEFLKINADSIAKKIGREKNCELVRGDCLYWLEKNMNMYLVEDAIIYLDPPYEAHQLYYEVIEVLIKNEFKGELWIESDEQKGIKADSLEERYKFNVISVYNQNKKYILKTYLK